jgi:tRNA-binding protein
MIDYELFRKVDMRVGTVVAVRPNEKARVPSYVLTVDLGDLGTRLSSAQVVDLYDAKDLVGRQVVCVVNFPPKRIAGVKSEVLILGIDGDGGVVLLAPERQVGNGVRVY